MLIRVEIGIDAPGIDALLRRTFGRDAEAQLVHDLREDGLITLGVVATDDEGPLSQQQRRQQRMHAGASPFNHRKISF